MPAEPRWRDRLGTVRVRVTAGALVVMAAALVVGALILVGLLRRALVAELSTSLETRVSDLAVAASDGTLPDPVPVLAEETGLVQVVDADGLVVASTPGLEGPPILVNGPPPPSGASMTFELSNLALDDDDQERFQVLAATVATPSGDVTIYAASSLSRIDDQVRRLELVLFGGIPVLLAVLGVTTWWVVGRALSPVERLRREVEQIQADRLDRRVAEPVRLDEVGRLAHTMNVMLERLDESVANQQRFAADASHELRSPVTAARTELEVALAYPERADWPSTATDVLAELDRLEVLARDLLALTRVDPIRRMADAATVDVASLTHVEVDRRRLGSAHVIELDSPDAAVVLGDESLLTRLVRNLLDNAERHATSCVRVTVTSAGGEVRLVVANDGVAIARADRERVFEPFTRLDAARATDDGGTGLGLTIVRDIARAHGGSVVVADLADGAAFEVTLPGCRRA